MKTFRIDVIGLVMSAITIVFTTTVNAFVVLPTPTSTSCITQQHHQPSGRVVTVSTTTRSTRLQMAGFGSGGGMASSSSSSSSKKGKKKKETSSSSKLKPRKQWDRFLSQELETSDRIRVAVRLVQVNDNDTNDDDDNNKWFSVGEIKSKDNMYTEASVIRHRVLIADHARRIYPAEIRINDKLDWGYNINTNSAKKKDEEEKEEDSDENNENENENENENDENDNDWTIVQKLDDMPNDIDKFIGFQGYADPTGFYSSTGTFRSKASGNIKQTGYNTSMGMKGTVGHSPMEVHD